jgi:hypothetical protein
MHCLLTDGRGGKSNRTLSRDVRCIGQWVRFELASTAPAPGDAIIQLVPIAAEQIAQDPIACREAEPVAGHVYVRKCPRSRVDGR